MVQCLAPSHYLNQCWIIVSWTLRDRLQWNLKIHQFCFRKMHLKIFSADVSHFVQASMCSISKLQSTDTNLVATTVAPPAWSNRRKPSSRRWSVNNTTFQPSNAPILLALLSCICCVLTRQRWAAFASLQLAALIPDMMPAVPSLPHSWASSWG